jgi:hypothetical protein
MAREFGVSSATVQRIWSARGLKPHLVETFKLSNDPRFEGKLVDVVGLYLNPPDNAAVLCVDEKSRAPRGAGEAVRDGRPAAGHRSDRSKLLLLVVQPAGSFRRRCLVLIGGIAVATCRWRSRMRVSEVRFRAGRGCGRRAVRRGGWRPGRVGDGCPRRVGGWPRARLRSGAASCRCLPRCPLGGDGGAAGRVCRSRSTSARMVGSR